MTTSTDMFPPPGRGAQDGAGPDRSLVALLAAAALVVVVVVLVLMFGIARAPALPELAEEPFPELSLSVAWNAWDEVADDREPATCLILARPDGTREQLACDRDGGEVVAWDDDGIVQRSWGMRDEVVWYDPVTGHEVRREAVGGDRDLSPPRDADVSARREDGELVVRRDDTDAVIWATSAPENYRINAGAVSPDGAWVAMFDSADRLLVVPADGSREPRVWVEDTPTWERPVWEGTSVPTGSS